MRDINAEIRGNTTKSKKSRNINAEIRKPQIDTFFSEVSNKTQDINTLLTSHVDKNTLSALTQKKTEVGDMLSQAERARQYYKSVGNNKMLKSVNNVTDYLKKIDTAIDNRRGLNGSENMFSDILPEKKSLKNLAPTSEALNPLMSADKKKEVNQRAYDFNMLLKHQGKNFDELSAAQDENSKGMNDTNREILHKENQWLESYKQSIATDEDYKKIVEQAENRVKELEKEADSDLYTEDPRNAEVLRKNYEKRTEERNKEISYYQGIVDKYSDYAKYGKSNVDNWNNELNKMSLEEMEKYSSANSNITNSLKNKIAEMDGGSAYLKSVESMNSQPSAEGFIEYRANANMEDFSAKEKSSLYSTQNKSAAAVQKAEYIQEYIDNHKKETTDYDDLEYIKNQYDSEMDNAGTYEDNRDILDVKAEWQKNYLQRYNVAKQERNFTSLPQEEQEEILNQTALSLNLDQTFRSGDKEYIDGLDLSKYEGNFSRNKKAELEERGYSPEEADSILSYAERIVNSEIAEKQKDKAIQYGEEHQVRATVNSVSDSITSGIGAVSNMWTKLKELNGSEVPIDWNSAENRTSQQAQNLRTGVKNTINNEFGQFVYDAFTSSVDSAATLPLNYLVPGATTVILGSSAAQQRMLEAHERGMGDAEAIGNGLVAGVFEGLFESVSLDKIVKLGSGTKNIKDFLVNMGKSMGIEGSEELFTEVANIAYDTLANGELSDYQTSVKAYMQQGYTEYEAEKKSKSELAMRVAESAAGGMLGGAFFGGTFGGINYAANSPYRKMAKYGRNIKDNNTLSELQTFIEKNYTKDSQLYKQMQETDLNDSAYVGYLATSALASERQRAQQSWDNAVIPAVEQRLGELGVKEADREIVANEVVYKKNYGKSGTVSKTGKRYEDVINQVASELSFKDDSMQQWVKDIDLSWYEKHNQNADKLEKLTRGESFITKKDNSESKKIKSKISEKTENGYVTDGRAHLTDDENVKFDITSLVVREADGKTVAAVKTDDGKTELYDMEDVSADKDIVELYLRGQKYDPEQRKAFFMAYDEGGRLASVENFAYAYDEVYNYGAEAVGMESIMQNEDIQYSLTPQQIEMAYNAGKLEYDKNVVKKQQSMLVKGRGLNQGTVNFDSVDEKKLNKTQKSAVDVAQVITKATGVNITFFESVADENGIYQDENGSYDWNTNSVRIDINAGMRSKSEGNNIMVVTLAHELTHYIERFSPKQYGQIQEFIFDKLSQKENENINTLINREIKRLKNEDKQRGVKAKTEERYREIAKSEIVARGCELMLTDKNAVRQLAETNRGIFGKLKSKIDKLVQSIEDACNELLDREGNYKEGTVSREAQLLKDHANKIRTMWNEALKEAGENEKVGYIEPGNRSSLNMIRYDVNNTPFVEIEEDILNGVPEKEWIKTVISIFKTKFTNGIKVANSEIWQNAKNRGEYFYSKYTEWLKNSNHIIYTDKLKMANNIDEILKASKDYVNEELNHIRKDNIKEFARGDVNIRIGKNDYNAKVVIGFTGNKLQFYDIIDINPIKIKERSNKTRNTIVNKSHPNIASSNNSISDNHENSNNNLKQSRNVVDSEGNTLTEQQQEYFRDSKVRDEDGNLKVMYHGTARADRVGYYFNPDRATSGPMAFFTDSEEIANNYARDKEDTSIAYDEVYDDYYTQFRIDINGTNMSISEAWNKLPYAKRMEIKEKAPHIVFDDDYENIIYDENSKYGLGNLDAYTINMHKGNMLEVLTDCWLESGELLGHEEDFIEVLKMAGLDDVQYMNPDFRDEKTYEVYLNVTNPFYTTNISEEMLNKFKEATETAEVTEGNMADMWDKRNIAPEKWIEGLEDDISNGTTYSWTRIPDFVTDVLKEEGYDGIFDLGGKGGGIGHMVVIPFYSNQIKNITNENPTEDVDIRYQSRDYSYSELIKKPNITVPVLNNVQMSQYNSRADILNEAMNNLKKDKDVIVDEEIATIHNNDTDRDIEVSKRRLRHGIARRVNEASIFVTLNIGDAIKYGINVNEATGERNNADSAFVLVGKLSNIHGQDYYYRLIVNTSNDGEYEVNRLYAAKAKKKVLGGNAPTPASKKTAKLNTFFKLKVSDFLNEVKDYYGDSLSEDVNNHFGKVRGKSDIDGLLYQSRYTTPKTYDEALIDNESYKKALKHQNGLLEISGMQQLSNRGIERLTYKLIKETKTILSKDELKGAVKEVFDKAAEEKWERTQIIEALKQVTYRALNEKRQNIKRTDYAQTILDELRKTRIRLTEDQASGIYAATGMKYGDWRKNMMGKIIITNNGTGTALDSKWEELSRLYPEAFSEDVLPEDMPTELETIIFNLQNDYENDWGFNFEDAAEYCATEVLAEYARLPEVRNSINEAETYQKLQEKYDSQLGTVRVEYNKRIREFRKGQFKDLQEARKQWKEDQRAREKALKERYENLMNKRIANLRTRENSVWMTRDKEKLRNNIVKTVKRINTLVVRPTNQKHAPQGFLKKTAEFCQLFMNDTSVFSQSALDNLKVAYAALKPDTKDENGNTVSYTLQDSYDVDIQDMIETLRNTIAGKRLSQLSLWDLKTVNDIVTHFDTIIKNEREIEINGRQQDIEAVSHEFINELSEKGQYGEYFDKAAGFKESLYNNLTPIYFFKRLGKTAEKLFKDVLEGQNKAGKNIHKARIFIMEIKNKHHYDSWDFKDTVEIGDGIKLTVEQALYIYATKNRENKNVRQNAQHLSKGGIILKEKIAYEDKKKLKLNKKMTQQSSYHVRAADLAKISNFLTAEQKAYADEMVRYLSEDMARLGNETSMQLYGYEKFDENYYFPYKTADSYVEHSATAHQDVESSIMAKSFTKSLTDEASTPVVIGEFTETAAEHINGMVTYNALAVAQNNLNKVFNYVEIFRDSETGEKMETGASVKQMIAGTHGEKAQKYFKNFILALNGGLKTDPAGNAFSKFISMFKKSKTYASASVIVQQPSSVCRAMALVSPKYFNRIKLTKKHWEECKKYNGVAVIKEMGGFDTGMGRGTVEYLTNKTPETAPGKVKKFADEKVLGRMPGKMDEITWCTIWNAVKNETKDKGGFKGNEEEFFKAASERFNEVITKTQVYDSVISKSANMSSKENYMKMITAFMSEPTVSLNMFVDAVSGGNGKKNAAKIITSVVMQTVVNGALKALVLAARNDRDKDEDKSYWEKYAKAFSENVFGTYFVTGEWNPITFIPFVKDVMSIFEGYDVSRTDMTVVTELKDALETTASLADEDSDTTWSEAVLELASAVSAFTGVPVGNIIKDIIAAGNLFSDFATKNVLPSGKGKMFNAFLEGIGFDFSDQEKVKDYIKSGEKEILNELIEASKKDVKEKYPGYSDEKILKEAKSNVRTKITKELKSDYFSGDVKKDDTIKKMKSTGLYVDEDGKDASKDTLTDWEVSELKKQYMEVAYGKENAEARKEIRNKLYKTKHWKSLSDLDKQIKKWTE